MKIVLLTLTLALIAIPCLSLEVLERSHLGIAMVYTTSAEVITARKAAKAWCKMQGKSAWCTKQSTYKGKELVVYHCL